MADNILTQIRQAFQIPDSVIIRTVALADSQILKSSIGAPEKKFDIPAINESYKGSLTTPVFTDLEFQSVTYETNIKGRFITTPNIKYYTVLLGVTQAKKIVKTEIQGRDGTVKEYIGMDDYGITINGVITAGNGYSPASDVSQLKQILDAPIPIPVASAYLNNLSITNLVIESYELAQEAGGYSYQTFTINAISDVPVELRLSNV